MSQYTPPLPVQNFVAKSGPVVGAAWLNAMDNILQGNVPANGIYSPTFLYGQVQLTGPNGNLISFGDFGFGLATPGPGGTGRTLLIGGATQQFVQVVTDEQVPGQKGISMYIAAGESATGTTDGGGDLWLFGGASDFGKGGDAKFQAGTSAHGVPGDVYILGGNSSNNLAPAGNVYLLAGTAGSAGGSVKVYATYLNGVGGDISFWLGQVADPHSIPLFTMSHTGAFFPGNQGAGNPGDVFLSGGNLAQPTWAPFQTQSVDLVLSGGTVTTPTASFNYTVFGNAMVALWCDTGVVAQASDPSDLILSTLPSLIRPDSPRTCACYALMNNGGSGFYGMATISPAGGVQISLATSVGLIQSGAFTPGGNKGLLPGFCILYPL